MKYRLDQVTNSSSSSFVCDVCNHVESGWDISLSEAEMYECENGHTVCESHVDLGDEKELATAILNSALEEAKDRTWGSEESKARDIAKIEELLKAIAYEGYDDFYEIFDDYDMRHNLPAKFCPICNHEHIPDNDALAYALNKLGITEEELKAEIRKNFAEDEAEDKEN